MLDLLDRRIIEVLSGEARTTLRALAKRVGLSSPSVAERLYRLQERGVVRAFSVDLDPRALGYEVQAIVRVRPLAGRSRAVEQRLVAIPEIVECDKVTGDDCFVARVLVRSIEDLDRVLEPITDEADTSTAIVKSQPIERRLPPLGGA